ncbi:MAG: tetrathionate reductase family octaheme c-type cytochrome [Deltaproteobacteria bacterium]|nr:tetrathionate reductase family octaheme c-type cytochrome [Deltaproteobacteria bacterium]
MGVKKILVVTALAVLTAGTCWAEVPADHADIEGPFNTPMEVTATCLECHEDAATEVMATSHWTWNMEQEIAGKMVKRGKKNVLNNFCISVNSNWPRCTSCHVGYGWKDASFDFSDPTRVDCLACHDTTGTYNKGKDAPSGAGMPAGYTGNPKFDKKPVDLIKIAQNAGAPNRTNCLNCHAVGGGGDNVKHGDIDQSLINPTSAIDVHMGVDGNDFTCNECHAAEGHKIPGNSMIVSPAGKSDVNCTICHDEPHSSAKMGGVLNKHTKKVACQTCHIPVFAKKHATKMTWDWSQAKNPKDLPEDKRVIKEHGHKVYIAKKGKFTYEDNVVPTYAWYNGTAGAYQLGQKIDPNNVTQLNYPLGDRNDANAKIHPFKIHKAVQIYDNQNNYLITPKVWGPKKDPDAFWVNFDWNKAAAAGMKTSGLEYSGSYDFTKTETYWPINHMVSPADKALQCIDCHGDSQRIDWKSLGYDMDPMAAKKAKIRKKLTH